MEYVPRLIPLLIFQQQRKSNEYINFQHLCIHMQAVAVFIVLLNKGAHPILSGAVCIECPLELADSTEKGKQRKVVHTVAPIMETHICKDMHRVTI